jgi:hypothetical protein
MEALKEESDKAAALARNVIKTWKRSAECVCIGAELLTNMVSGVGEEDDGGDGSEAARIACSSAATVAAEGDMVGALHSTLGQVVSALTDAERSLGSKIVYQLFACLHYGLSALGNLAANLPEEAWSPEGIAACQSLAIEVTRVCVEGAPGSAAEGQAVLKRVPVQESAVTALQFLATRAVELGVDVMGVTPGVVAAAEYGMQATTPHARIQSLLLLSSVLGPVAAGGPVDEDTTQVMARAAQIIVTALADGSLTVLAEAANCVMDLFGQDGWESVFAAAGLPAAVLTASGDLRRLVRVEGAALDSEARFHVKEASENLSAFVEYLGLA